MNEMRIIEAALFSAGAPLSIEELKEATEFKEKEIKDILKRLISDYQNLDISIEIAQVGEKYAMQLKSEFAGHVQRFAAMEIPVKVLKTAALIAYHQPVKQKDLADMIGYKVYEHVKELSELGLIHRRDYGRTKIITTTARFSEYFGIASTDREEIKKWLVEKLDVKMPEKPGETKDEGVETTEENKEEENKESVKNSDHGGEESKEDETGDKK